MTHRQLALGQTVRPDRPTPYTIEPNPRLLRNPNYIHQYVEKCPYGCGQALLIQEWLDGGHPTTILRDPINQHREDCPAYHKNRILIDEE